MTAEQIAKKYRGKYVEVREDCDYSTGKTDYIVHKSYSEIHENTTRAEDVGTSRAYTR